MKLSDVNKIKPAKTHSSMQEVSKFMGISYMTLYRLVKNGKIKAYNLAPKGAKKPIFGFLPEDVQKYYDSLQDPSNRPEAVHQ